MVFRTKGELEAAIGNAVMKFEREYFGRGPKELHTYVLRDMVIIRQNGILTPAEEQVRENPESVDLIQRLRETLLKNNQDVLSAIFQKLTGAAVLGVYTDQLNTLRSLWSLLVEIEAPFRRTSRRSS